MTTQLTEIRAEIGDGGFSAPIGPKHKRAILLDCDGDTAVSAQACRLVYDALADRADWRPSDGTRDNRAFMTCRGYNVAAIMRDTCLSRSIVTRALARLQERGWLKRDGHTNPVFTLNADKLRRAAAEAKERAYVPPADKNDVDALLTRLAPRPDGKKANQSRERQTAAYLLQYRTADEICTAIDDADVPVFTLQYVATAFQIAAKRTGPRSVSMIVVYAQVVDRGCSTG